MALRWTAQGIGAAWRHESSFRIATFSAVLLAPIGILLADDAREFALLVGSLWLLLTTVLLQSAIKAVIGRFGDERHELTVRASHMADGAVLVVAACVGLTWILLLV